jgi:uncharacterized protein (TIRG00374 family)
MIICGLVFYLGPELRKLPQVVQTLSWPMFLFAFIVNVVGSVLLPAMASNIALTRERLQLSLWDLVRVNFVTRFYSLFLPRGGAFAMRWHQYKKSGSGGDAFALVIFEKLVIVFAYSLAAVVFILIEIDKLGSGKRETAAALVAVFLAMGLGISPFLSFRCSQLLSTWFGAERRGVPKFVTRTVNSVLSAVSAYQSLDVRSIVRILLTTVLGYWLFVLSAYILAVDMGLSVGLMSMAWVRSAVFMLTLIPITVGGLGVREIGFVGLLGLYGVGGAEAVTFGLANFAVQAAIGLVGAGYEVRDLIQKKRGNSK